MHLDAARLMILEAACLLDEERDVTRAACLTRNFADEMALMFTDRAVQILGGHGYIRDYPVEMCSGTGSVLISRLQVRCRFRRPPFVSKGPAIPR